MGWQHPAPKEWSEFSTRFWEEFFYPSRHEIHLQRRDLWEDALKAVKGRLGTNPTFEAAERAIELAKKHDALAINFRKTEFPLADALAAKRPKQAALILAERYGVPTRAISGADLDKRVTGYGQ